MHKALSKAVVVVVMLVAFLGQAMAMSSLISNESSDKNSYQSSFAANSLVKAEKPQINALALADCSDPICCDLDCCDNDCVCAASNCSSLVYLNSEIGTVQLPIFSEILPPTELKQVNSIISIHYRPPIFITIS